MSDSDEVGDDLDELEELLEKLSNHNLTSWEQDFVEDLANKVEKYQERTFVSVRQWEQLDRMRDKYL